MAYNICRKQVIIKIVGAILPTIAVPSRIAVMQAVGLKS